MKQRAEAYIMTENVRTRLKMFEEHLYGVSFSYFITNVTSITDYVINDRIF